MKGKQYNHMFDVAFTLSNHKKGSATSEEILMALEKRLIYLKQHPEEVQQACGLLDTYQEGGSNGN